MYYSFTDIEFWLYGLISLIALIVSCYFPGWLVVKTFNFPSKISETMVSTVTGITFWAFQGHVFGYFGTRYLTYVYLILTCILIWRYRKELFQSQKKLWQEIKNVHVVIWLSLIISVIVQLYPHFNSGFITNEGVPFYFVNSVDGVMHLSYIQSMVHHLPPIEPGFAGRALENYHYWGDLVLAEFVRVWSIPTIHLFFQYAPLILITLTSVLIIQVVKALRGNTTAVVLALFLTTFGADATFILSYYLNHNWGTAVAALDTGPSFIFNMPQVFARVVLLALFSLFLLQQENKNNKIWFLIAVLGASLFNFKVYYGIYFALGLGFWSLFLLIVSFKNTWKKNSSTLKTLQAFLKNNFNLLVSLIIFVAIIGITFLPSNSNSGGLFWEPLAWTKKLLSADNLNYQEWFLRMQVYEQSGNTKNIFAYNFLAISMTLLAIYGGRLLGFFPLGISFKNFPKEFLVLVIPANIIFILVGFLFLQTTGGFNIYNFLITPILIFNIISAITFSSLKNKALKFTTIIFLVLLSLPRSVFQLSEYKERYHLQKADYLVSNAELELFSQLQSLEQGVVQADPANSYENKTPYVSFFSNQQTYLGGANLLKMDAELIKERETKITDLFASTNEHELSQKMQTMGVQYLYVTDPEYRERFRQILINSQSLQIVKENDKGMILSRI